jgi:hypothetical protein
MILADRTHPRNLNGKLKTRNPLSTPGRSKSSRKTTRRSLLSAQTRHRLMIASGTPILMSGAQQGHHVFSIGAFSEPGETAQVVEKRSNLSTMAFELLLSAGSDDQEARYAQPPPNCGRRKTDSSMLAPTQQYAELLMKIFAKEEG